MSEFSRVMTSATDDQRTVELARLRCLRGMPDDVTEHVSMLEGITLDHMRTVVRYVLTTEEWFPTPAKLAAIATRLMPRIEHPAPQRKEVPHHTMTLPNPFGGADVVITVTHEPYFDCTLCEDTAFSGYWCGPSPSPRFPWLALKRCWKDGCEGGHEWVDKCPCAATNPTIQRKRAAQARVARDAAEQQKGKAS